MEFISKLLKNPTLNYVISRYATYGLQFINSLFIAAFLGPVYLGIWGFVNLVVQYLSQLNLGIAHAVNTIAAIHKYKVKYISYVVGNAAVILFFLSTIITIFFFLNHFLQWDFGQRYQFGTYSFFVLFIGICSYFNSLLTNVFRIYGRIMEMALSQSMLPLATTFVLFFYRGEALLYALVWAYVITSLLSLVMFLVLLPIPVRLNADRSLWHFIQRKGLHLFLYNTSFYLIIISTRSFVSAYYHIEAFGFFTFAFSLASTMSLLLDSFAFLLWPKLLNRLSIADQEANLQLIKRMRDIYITSTHALMHLGIFLFPFFLLLFPAYKTSYSSFCFILLTTALFANSFGYQGLLIAKGKEKEVGVLAFCSLLLNIFLCYVLITVVHVSYDKVILATLVTYLIYIFCLCVSARRILSQNSSMINVLKDAMPLTIMIPYLVSLFLIGIQVDPWFLLIPIFAFLILNHRKIALLKASVLQLIKKPTILDI